MSAAVARDDRPGWTGTFRIEEATIADVHRAIQQGLVTCRGVVEAYVDRARAYNGVSDRLVTADGAAVAAAPGTVRAGTPLQFPTETVAVSTLLPDYDRYIGPPIELGRMEATASDPDVQQQYGMTVGTPDTNQINALGTLNLRGERSVTCKGDRDRPLSAGPPPAGSPAVCEEFRKQPDALERADELDKQYGTAPDLAAMPMYCIPFSFRIRSTRWTCGRRRRPTQPTTSISRPATTRSSPSFDRRAPSSTPRPSTRSTTAFRRPWRSSRAREGARIRPRVSAEQLVRQPAQRLRLDARRLARFEFRLWRVGEREPRHVQHLRGDEHVVPRAGQPQLGGAAPPHKSMISFQGGAIGADVHNDRSGIHCRSVTDSAKVLDALKDPANGYDDPRDVFTTVPRASVGDGSFAAAASSSGAPGSLKGVRIGVIRESMLTFPGVKADEPIARAAAKEITDVLATQLGATLVESTDPLWTDDPSIENMTTSYTRALAELVPIFFPDLLYRLNGRGEPVFPEFAAAIKPTEFAPGKTFGSGSMAPVDYMLAMTEGRVPPPRALNIRTIQTLAAERQFRFHVAQYLSRRAADWKTRGFTETLVDWPTLNARSKFWSDEQRASWKNWEEVDTMMAPLGERQGVAERLMLRELLRRVEMKVIQENKLDVVVRLHTSLPPGKIGLAGWPGPAGETRGDIRMGPYSGETEVLIPAGYVREVYDARFALSPDRQRYVAQNSDTPTTVPEPGLPFSLVFRAEPGAEDRILKVASAYEAASKRRVAPPAYPELRGE